MYKLLWNFVACKPWVMIKSGSIAITSNSYECDVVRAFKILSLSYFEIWYTLLLITVSHPVMQLIIRTYSSCLLFYWLTNLSSPLPYLLSLWWPLFYSVHIFHMWGRTCRICVLYLTFLLSIMSSRSAPVVANDKILPSFYGWRVFHCVYKAHFLYSFLWRGEVEAMGKLHELEQLSFPSVCLRTFVFWRCHHGWSSTSLGLGTQDLECPGAKFNASRSTSWNS
jgi:hypothetical protein